MKVHEVFPTLVAQDIIEIHEEFKNQYFEELKSLWFNGYENETPENPAFVKKSFNSNSLLLTSNL